VKTLLLLRHAKSSWADPALDDHDRRLNERGRRDAPRMGDLIRVRRLSPDVIISSDAVRARLTAEAVAQTARCSGKIQLDPRLYLADPGSIVNVLRTLPDSNADTVMVVGHNPGLEDLIAKLTGEHPDMPTCALARIALPIVHWRDLRVSSEGTLLALWRPKDLDLPT
jgi:phosphohistidine phosphatase